MPFMDTMMMKKSLPLIGVDRNALFSDPKAYLKENPIVMHPVKPWLLVLMIIILLPLLTFVTGKLLLGQNWITATCITGGIGFALGLAMLFINHKEECRIDETGMTLEFRNIKVKAPWEVFNKDGTSKLDAGLVIEVPVNLKKWDQVVFTTNGESKSGEGLTAPHFRLMAGKEMVAIRNFYPLGATDFAELIRRVALTLGHQEPPAPPAEA